MKVVSSRCEAGGLLWRVRLCAAALTAAIALMAIADHAAVCAAEVDPASPATTEGVADKASDTAAESAASKSPTTADADAAKSDDSSMPLEPIDLTKFYIVKAEYFDRMSYPWGVGYRGKQTVGGIPLDIGGFMCTWGESNAKRGDLFTKEIKDVPVKRKFETLYIYQTCLYPEPEDDPIYTVKMKYDDGTESAYTLYYGQHMRDWHQFARERVNHVSAPNSRTAFRGDHPRSKGTKLRFYITAVPNPTPEKEVASLSFVSAEKKSAGCILALTTGPADRLKLEEKMPDPDSLPGEDQWIEDGPAK